MRPTSPSWRTDPLAPSPHTRHPPGDPAGGERFDLDAAADVCADVARRLLGDYAPALTLLPFAERRRTQALLAYARALFDFAGQPGPDGERLAMINRLEFDLDRALSGAPPGQPIFLRLAFEEGRRTWPREALDRLARCARRRATRSRPATPAEAEAAATDLAGAVLAALVEGGVPAEVENLGGALLRLGDSEGLGEEAQERLRRAQRDLAALPKAYRRAALYAVLAARRRLGETEAGPTDVPAQAPRLTLGTRIVLLLRARWLGR